MAIFDKEYTAKLLNESEQNHEDLIKKAIKSKVQQKVKNNDYINVEDLDDWDKPIDGKVDESSDISKKVKDHEDHAMSLSNLDKLSDSPYKETEDEKLKREHPDAWGIKHGTYAVTKEPNPYRR